MERSKALMLALAGVSLVGLFIGLRDVTIPLATGAAAFGHLQRPHDWNGALLLAGRAFVHNWGIALVVPVVGGIAVHYEPRARLIAAILAGSVGIGFLGGFFMLPLPPGGLREYILVPLELLGVAAAVVYGASAVAAGHRGATLEETCRLQWRHSRVGILLSGGLLLWAMTYEARLFLA